MQSQTIQAIRTLFQSRLATLEHLLPSAQTHFGDTDSFLEERIVADMISFERMRSQKSRALPFINSDMIGR